MSRRGWRYRLALSWCETASLHASSREQAQLEDLPAPFREMIEALNGQSIGALARRPAGEGEEEEELESVD